LRGEHKALRLLKKLRDKEKFELWTGAMHVGGKIYTLNTEHYPMPEVVAPQLHKKDGKNDENRYQR
jgi:hypothetical protein